MEKKEAYKHYYSGNFDPAGFKNPYAMLYTFSVGCFQCLPKSGGKGLKKGKVKVRVKGLVSNPDLVYQKAEEICQKLDNGWVPDKKTYSVIKYYFAGSI